MDLGRVQKVNNLNSGLLNRIEISSNTLKKNYRRLALINKKIKVAPVLKSNAYGHGLVQVAKILDKFEPPFFCVNSFEEAYELMENNIKTKILIMGSINPENLTSKKLPFTYVISDLNQLKNVFKYQKSAAVHIFVDTGMHREGILLDDLDIFLKRIPQNSKKNIEGIMSHFAASENPGNKDTISQVINFKKALNVFKNNNINPRWVHIANSEGLLNNKDLGINNITNLARVGFHLYDNVARLFTKIIQIKKIKKGDKVGYDFTFTADREMTIAILPIGYNDGVSRGFSNHGRTIINRISCPIVGRVSMNITIIDITQIDNPKLGDNVEIDIRVPIPGKILYEIIVGLNPFLKRIIVD